MELVGMIPLHQMKKSAPHHGAKNAQGTWVSYHTKKLYIGSELFFDGVTLALRFLKSNDEMLINTDRV